VLSRWLDIDWPAGMLLSEALGRIHRLTRLDVAAFFREDKPLGTPLHGAFTLRQIMEQLATSAEADWSVGEAGVELVWVRDGRERVSYLHQFLRLWGELRPATREALLAGGIVLLSAQEKKALASFGGEVSWGDSRDDGNDRLGVSVNYDLDLLVYHPEKANQRIVLHLYERVLPPAGIAVKEENDPPEVWRPLAEGAETPQHPAVRSAAVAERTRASPHFAWRPVTNDEVVLPEGCLYTLGQLASALSAASGTELIVDRRDKEYLVYLSRSQESASKLVRWLVNRVGFDVDRVGSVYHLTSHPLAPLGGDFSPVDAINSLARTLGELVLSSDLERLGMPFTPADIRNARFFRWSDLSEGQKRWLQTRLRQLSHPHAGILDHYRLEFEHGGDRMFIRLLPRFFLRVSRYQPHESDVLVVRRFTDIPLDRLPLFPPTAPDTPYFRRLLWRQNFVDATLPKWEAHLATAITEPNNWLQIAQGLADIGRRKYAPYAQRLIRLGDTPVRAAAEQALHRMSLLPGATGNEIIEQIKAALRQPSPGGSRERVDWALSLGKLCATAGSNRPLDDLGTIYEQALEHLREQAKKDGDERARWAATAALYAARRTGLVFPGEVEEVRNSIFHPHPEVGQWFLEALRTRIRCQRRNFSAAEAELLLEAVESKQPHLTSLAVRTMGETGLQTLLPFLEQYMQNEDVRVPAITAAIDLLNLSAQQEVAGDPWTLEAFIVQYRSLELGTQMQMGIWLPELYLLGICATPESKAARVLEAMGLNLQDVSEAAREAIRDPEFQRAFDEIRRRGESEHGKEWWIAKRILRSAPTLNPFMEKLQQLAGQHPDWRIDSIDVLEALLTTDSPVVTKVLCHHGVARERIQTVVAQLGLQRGSGLAL